MSGHPQGQHTVLIRQATAQDADAIWQLLEPVLRSGETYALDPDTDREDALAYWTGGDRITFVAELEGRPAGTYSLRANNAGGGSHIANCAYVTAVDLQGRGIARAMCLHSLDEARRRGFLGIQFNFVIASNERAVRLWKSLGFDVVGRLPGAFRHPRLGYVDAFIMYRSLATCT